MGRQTAGQGMEVSYPSLVIQNATAQAALQGHAVSTALCALAADVFASRARCVALHQPLHDGVAHRALWQVQDDGLLHAAQFFDFARCKVA